jgi:histidinol-phosphate aminotransferase
VVVPDLDYGTDVDALIAHVTERTRVIFIANPNNPTGSFLSRAELARLHAALPGDVLLVLDQAYAEYVAPEDDDGSLELAAAHGNVLVTRTFSKAYGLAGERVGWATGAPELVEILNRLRGPFNLSNSAQATALAALGDQGFVKDACTRNIDIRARFVDAIEGLGNHGLRAIPSQANFVLVLFNGRLTAEAAYKGLAEAGTITRWLPGQGLPHGLRITIGTPEQMEAVVAALHRLTQAAR